jgi:hypothetical protein
MRGIKTVHCSVVPRRFGAQNEPDEFISRPKHEQRFSNAYPKVSQSVIRIDTKWAD